MTLTELISQQREITSAPSPSERCIGGLHGLAALRSRLDQLTDRQIGQLLFDFVWQRLHLLSPELAICEQGARRLLRSSARRIESEFDPDEVPACPECGCEMVFSVGIDQSDFWQCARLACRHKVQVHCGDSLEGERV